jgi:peptidyl-prolyl cis-trans isomerase SurA
MLAFGAPVARAQGLYSPELQVGDTVVTRYQIDQRASFLALLGAPGDTRALAREQLVNETLQLGAARDEGIEVTPDVIEQGITEFAARANLTADQFREITQRAGISPATVRDFFTAGVAWRETIRAKFGEEVRSTVSPDQVRRALAQFGTEGGERVLISEVILPVDTPETVRASEARAAKIATIREEAEFAAAARRFSMASSSARGGELNWLAMESLPPEVQAVLRTMQPGQISRPVTLSNGVGVFLLRDREIVAPGTPETLAVDYALFLVPEGRAEAERVAAEADVCDDFYGIAKGLPESRLVRETKPAAQLAPDIRAAIAGLDDGESTTALTRGGAATVLMLCERKAALESTVDADIVGNRLLNVRLGTKAAHYLAELRAKTDVVDLTAN